MRRRKLLIGKYDKEENPEPDLLTNMEKAIYTFLTPITPVNMLKDYGNEFRFLNGKGRNVISSSAIYPNFEKC